MTHPLPAYRTAETQGTVPCLIWMRFLIFG